MFKPILLPIVYLWGAPNTIYCIQVERNFTDSFESPVLGGRGSVSLSPILEPVADLCRRQTGAVGQLSLACGARVRVDQVRLTQQVAGPLLEAV